MLTSYKNINWKDEEVQQITKLVSEKKHINVFPHAIEKHYAPYIENIFVHSNKLIIFYGLLFYLSFCVFDYFAYNQYSTVIIGYRLVTFFILLVMAAVAYNENELQKSNFKGITIALCLASFQVCTASTLLPLPISTIYMSGIIAVFLVAVHILRHSLRYCAIFVSFNIIMVSSCLLYSGLTGSNELILNNAFAHDVLLKLNNVLFASLLFAAVLCLSVSALLMVYAIESLTRQSWLQLQLIQIESNKYKQLSETNRALSETDSLTELNNRRYFDIKMSDYWLQAAIDKTELAFILIDVDWFKKYNDRYGHSEGDATLKQIASGISTYAQNSTKAQNNKAPLKNNDAVVCRYGGEEFSVLLPKTNLTDARKVAEKIRTAIVALQIPHASTDTGFCTLSIGVGTIQPAIIVSKEKESIAIAEFISSVDDALYSAKSKGKNCVEEVSSS